MSYWDLGSEFPDSDRPEPTLSELKDEVATLKRMLAELMFYRISGTSVPPQEETYGSAWFVDQGWRFMDQPERRRYKLWLNPSEPEDSAWLNT